MKWLLGALLAMAAAYYYLHHQSRQVVLKAPNWSPKFVSRVVLSPQEVAKHNGVNGTSSYLIIMGEVYDVTGSEHYLPGSGYYVFIGKDSTASFVSGEFAQGGDDISSFSQEQLKGIRDWVEFYRKHDTYKFVGVVTGRYYSTAGHRSDEWKQLRLRMKTKQEEQPVEFPKCNMKWTSNQGSTSWCEGDGEIVPRSLIGHTPIKCVCVPLEQAKMRLEEFAVLSKCSETASVCKA
ncbi:hypothetical protein BASA81_006344 [Batrachochytrium salamandrivorans]|nr:hypothetical protein BASA81_006344 [Batrachochytrium salamandrivorans]